MEPQTGVSEMQNRTFMDLDRWRAALRRGELWMFVDQHWGETAPDGLTEQEWGLHISARVYAKTGTYPDQLFVANSAPAPAVSR